MCSGSSFLQQSIDFGASAVYVQGVIGDRWLREGRLDLLGQCVYQVKSRRLPGGIGAHLIEVIMEPPQGNPLSPIATGMDKFMLHM